MAHTPTAPAPTEPGPRPDTADSHSPSADVASADIGSAPRPTGLVVRTGAAGVGGVHLTRVAHASDGEVSPSREAHRSYPLQRRRRARAMSVLLACVAALIVSACVADIAAAQGLPRITLGVDQAQGPQETVTSLQIILLLTVITLAPAFLIMVTAFTRIVIVLSLIRNAIGVPQLPPNQVLLGLGLFLTFFVMAPVWQEVQTQAVTPFTSGEISQEQAFSRAERPIREFMLRQVRERDLALFVYLAKLDQPRTVDDVPTYVVVPAFIISELKTAFQMGFVIFIPFLVIDMVVSTILMSMGMMMLPPVLISLPFKILLFVMVDGWYLLTRALVLSFQ